MNIKLIFFIIVIPCRLHVYAAVSVCVLVPVVTLTGVTVEA